MFILLLSTLPTFDLITPRIESRFDVAHAVEEARHTRWRFLDRPALRQHQSEAYEAGVGELKESWDGSESIPGAPIRMSPERRQLERGNVWQYFTFDYPQMTAEQPSDLILEFRICVNCGGMLPEEKITLILPGFSRPLDLDDEDIIPEINVGEVGSIKEVIWDQKYETLTLTTAMVLPGDRPYRVIVPRSAGIRLPRTGVNDQTGIKVSTNAQRGGPANPTPVLGLHPVGSFTDSTAIDFSPRLAGSAAHVTLQFIPSMKIVAGEKVNFEASNIFCAEGGTCNPRTEIKFQSTLEFSLQGTRKNWTGMVDSTWRLVPYLNVPLTA